MRKRQGASLVVFVFGITAILALASLVVDIGVLINCQDELQKAVESAVLVGVSELEPNLNTGSSTVSVDSTQIQTIITDTFNKMIQGNTLISNVMTTPADIKIKSKAVRFTATATVKSYFTKFVGFDKFTITAKVAAISAPVYLSSKFPKGTTDGSIDDTNSDLRAPVGGNISQNYNGSDWEYDNIYGYPDNKALSLGPGGSITVKLPAPLVDNIGADLYIKELGNIKGYFVFAGNDDGAGGIKWVNISCTGIPVGVDQNSRVGAYYSTVSGNPAKFYGSGYFDLSLACTGSAYAGNIKNAKYLRIIDDNVEDGFMADDPSQPVILAGDHSSITPGANIDAVAILHHTRLIAYSDFNNDTDNDGLIDVLEKIIGTDPTLADTDGDTILDDTEYWGQWYDSSNTPVTCGASASKINTTSPTSNDTGIPGVINVN